jgi:hypothetical protein
MQSFTVIRMMISVLFAPHCVTVGRLLIGKRYGGRVKDVVW